MKIFSCQSCHHVLFFENTRCENCGDAVGYLPEEACLTALEPGGQDGAWKPLERTSPQSGVFYCANHAHDVCNWVIPAAQRDHDRALCIACSFNRIIPNLSVPGNAERWRRIESAKHRLFYSLLRFRLPLKNRREDPENGLAFDFLDDAPDGSAPVMTGHSNGVITLAIREADDDERERMRVQMGEYYRTLLGHFRHEIGHYYWNVLVRDGGRLEECRAVFGDDTQDYQEALRRHYDENPHEGNWRENYVSNYAASHPWEDFAETWAHYLHIVDTLETAWAYGVSISPAAAGLSTLAVTGEHEDPYTTSSFDSIMDAWLPLTCAVNSLNRSMGLGDFYPFILTEGVRHKLAFIHRLIRDTQAAQA